MRTTTLLLTSLAALTAIGCEPVRNVGMVDPRDGGPSTRTDARVPVPDGAATDAGAAIDAADVDAGGMLDAGDRDAMIVEVDGGGSDAGICECGPETCEDRVCGRSPCGRECGACAEGEHCFAGGSCLAGTGPGTACLDAFGDAVWEGDRGVRVCATDPSLVEPCTCGGGGATAWLGCEPCLRSCEPPGVPGLPCARDADCGPSLGCHPTLNVCGVRCDRGLGVVCPSGTTCTIPGDIAGVCLPTCACGSTECGLGWTCAPSEIGGVEASCQPGDGLLGAACP